MNTLVMNAESLAVTEYTTPFTGVSGNIEATADGVYRVEGSLDDGEIVESSFGFGLALSDEKQQRPKHVYVIGTGLDGVIVRVTAADGSEYDYESSMHHGRTKRFKLGAGLRDPYLKVTLLNQGDDAVPLNIDRLEFETLVSTQRRL